MNIKSSVVVFMVLAVAASLFAVWPKPGVQANIGSTGEQGASIDKAQDAPGAKGTTGQQSAKAVSVEVEEVRPGVFRQSLALSGSVEPTVTAGLASPAEGPVLECTVREGDQVRAGQTILRIGRRESSLAAQVAAAEELRRQEQEFKRVSTLVAQQAIPGEQLDYAKASFERAKAALSLADQTAGDYSVRAPWDGVVSQVRVSTGNFVAPRTPLVEMYAPSSLVLRFAVPEENAFLLNVGSGVVAMFDGVPDQEFALEIIRAFPQLDRRLRTRLFEARLPRGGGFVPGMFVRLKAVLKEDADTISVPSEALVMQGGGRFVFLLEGDKAALRQVSVGAEQDGRVLVRSGLKAGDKIIVSGIERVKNGAPVRALGAPAAAGTGAAS